MRRKIVIEKKQPWSVFLKTTAEVSPILCSVKANFGELPIFRYVTLFASVLTHAGHRRVAHMRISHPKNGEIPVFRQVPLLASARKRSLYTTRDLFVSDNDTNQA